MTADDLDPERAEMLRRKYLKQRPMDPRANTQVQACLRAERIIKRVWRNLAAADVVLLTRHTCPLWLHEPIWLLPTTTGEQAKAGCATTAMIPTSTPTRPTSRAW